MTVTLPARPPAMSANPRKSTVRAFHATPFPLYEKLSALRRDFSMLLMTSIPSAEQMKGIQSTKLMWTCDPLRGDFEYTLASMKKKNPNEN